MGAPRRSARDGVAALDEAIQVLRALWVPGPPVTFEGTYHRLQEARPGPEPRHDIGIWVGGYKRRMLELTARRADGWIPSSAYAAPDEIARMTATLDEAATAAGRNPGELRRAYNVAGSFGRGAGFLAGPPAAWAEQLAELAVQRGMSVFVLGPGPDPARELAVFAAEVAPAVREAVAAERSHPTAIRGAEPPTAEREAARADGRAGQQTLLAVHAHLRQELAQLQDLVQQVAQQRVSAAQARSHLNELTMRQNYWTLGSFCAAYCRVVSVHHAIEDARMFPDLLAADGGLQPVIAKLSTDHETIAGLLVAVDDALVAMVEDEDGIAETRLAVQRLAEVLLQHLDFEEEQLLGPIGELAIDV